MLVTKIFSKLKLKLKELCMLKIPYTISVTLSTLLFLHTIPTSPPPYQLHLRVLF